MRLPDLLEEIEKCRRHGQTHDACKVRYVDLAPSNNAVELLNSRYISTACCSVAHATARSMYSQACFYSCYRLYPTIHRVGGWNVESIFCALVAGARFATGRFELF